MKIQEKQWSIKDEVRTRTIGGEKILLTIKSNRLLVFNKQAAIIWDILGRGKNTNSGIIKALQKYYPGAPIKQLKIDVRGFLCNLQRKGFVHCNNESVLEIESEEEKHSTSGHLSFSEELHQRAAQNNMPISGCLELTQRCHLRCVHCYINNQPINRNNELSTAEFISLLEQIVECGCLWLLITGGEPLLRKDFAEIYCQAKELGMIVTIFTSVTNLTTRMADIFTKYPPFLVEATLHGATETTFDTITGVSSSFRWFQKGIQLLRDRNIPFHLKMIVMKQNLHEVEVAHQLSRELGAQDFRFDTMINADFLYSQKADLLRVGINEAIGLDLREPYRNRWERVYQTALEKQTSNPSSRRLLFPCRAGKCSFAISADGRLLPCILMRAPAYDLRTIPFEAAWHKLNRYVTTVHMQEDNPCIMCSAQTCSRCPAWGYLEHNNPNAKSRFACALQQERERLFLYQSRR